MGIVVLDEAWTGQLLSVQNRQHAAEIRPRDNKSNNQLRSSGQEKSTDARATSSTGCPEYAACH